MQSRTSAVKILDPLAYSTTCNLISPVYVFLITTPPFHHKNKSNSLRLWKGISKVKLLRQNLKVWPWRLKQNISWQIGFQATIFVFINQAEFRWWQWHKHMTPRAKFYPKPTLQALIQQTYGLAPFTRWHRDLRKGMFAFHFFIQRLGFSMNEFDIA